MSGVELKLRNVLRRTGVAGILFKALNYPMEMRKRRLARRFERERPQTVVFQVDSAKAVLRVSNAQEYAHYLSGSESAIMRVVLGRLKAGDTVWDIGANVGMYSVLMAGAVG